MKRASFTLTIAGLLLGSFGLALFNFGGVPQTTTAASYSTTWTATKILTVNADFDTGSLTIGEAGIGVWEWFVDGSIDNNTSFTETWSAPPIGSMSFTPGTSGGCNIISVDGSKILAGCFANQGLQENPETKTYIFSVKAVNDYTSKINGLNAGSGTQKTVSCINSPRDNGGPECLYQTGSYNFQHIIRDANNDTLVGGGTLMPLEWIVDGTISD